MRVVEVRGAAWKPGVEARQGRCTGDGQKHFPPAVISYQETPCPTREGATLTWLPLFISLDFYQVPDLTSSKTHNDTSVAVKPRLAHQLHVGAVYSANSAIQHSIQTCCSTVQGAHPLSPVAGPERPLAHPEHLRTRPSTTPSLLHQPPQPSNRRSRRNSLPLVPEGKARQLHHTSSQLDLSAGFNPLAHAKVLSSLVPRPRLPVDADDRPVTMPSLP